jgi:putative spermidine/putrescine transport system permease protein
MRTHRGPLARSRLTLSILAVWLLRIGAFLLLFSPIALVIVTSFGAGSYVTIPPHAWSVKWYVNILARDEFVSSFLTSLSVAAVVTPIAVLTGTLGAYGLWKYPSRRARALEQVLMAPILLPLVVTGLAFLVFINRMHLGSGIGNIIVAHVVITFPYAFRAVLATLGRYDRRMDEAAASLGVRPAKAFVHVTLPLIRPGLFAGALFAFVMSFDDFAATIFLISPGTQTLPIAIYQYMEFNLDPTVSAVSTVLVVIATGVVMLVERVVGMDRFVGVSA